MRARSRRSRKRRPSYAVNYPLGDFGRAEPPEAAEADRVQERDDLDLRAGGNHRGRDAGGSAKGRSSPSARTWRFPREPTVIDAAGKHITPGIIDCHSHMATDGGVNEAAQAITAEVRIGDFIDADDITIYRQLAGGVTSSNILHGSANPIGGQNQVIKLRWGATGEQMKFADAPPGIKFALGENVKQSNWERAHRDRYPQTRMGVEQIIRDAFAAATRLRGRSGTAGTRSHDGLPPRRDLELEALAEVVQRKRWIHCHSYRQDEILALIRTCDDFKIKIGTLQHILEGYKVADAMAKHGATGSSFSDWWAYKFEVFDAIPFNGALMHHAGVVVSFNSDDARAGPAPQSRSGQSREVRRRAARRSPQVRHAQSGQAAAHRPAGSARSKSARTPTSSSGAAIRSRPARAASRPGSTAASISTATTTGQCVPSRPRCGPP